MIVRQRSLQAVTQLAVAPQMDEACAPTTDSLNPLKFEGLRAALAGAPRSGLTEYVEDVAQVVEGELDAALATSVPGTAAQHAVPQVRDVSAQSALCENELCANEPSLAGLARDLGVGRLGRGPRDDAGTLQDWGLPLRV